MSSQLTNKEFADNNPEFREACRKAGLEPTARQASKFRNRHGRSWETWLKMKGNPLPPLDTED